MKTLLTTAIILMCTAISFGQTLNPPLEQKVENAKMIIEGEVHSSTCFKSDDGNLYTENVVEIYKSFKGMADNTYISIVTRGGEVDGEIQRVTHSLSLKPSAYGIFFLKPSSVHNPEPQNENFTVYFEDRGFLRFLQETDGTIAYAPRCLYTDIESELYQKIEAQTGITHSVFKENSFKSSLEIELEKLASINAVPDNCLEFLFEIEQPNPQNLLVNDVTVSIRTTGTGKYISKPTFGVKYNPNVVGQNAASNGAITLQDLGISGNENYQAIVEDVTVDKVKVTIDATNLQEPNLFYITTQYTPLVRMRVQLPSLTDPEFLLDQQMIQSLSKYYDVDDNIERLFDCVKVNGDIAAFTGGGCEPFIGDMLTTPLTILELQTNGNYPEDMKAAGTDMILVIVGTCFGDEQGSSIVEFTNAHLGPDPVMWIDPLPEDYVSWNNNSISVYIPSNAGFPEEYAGSGHVRVNRNADGIGTSFDELDIAFALENYVIETVPAQFSPNHTVPALLYNYNQIGGYYYTYTATFEANAERVAAFERAMDTWRCDNSLVPYEYISQEQIVDFEIDPASVCTVDYGPLQGRLASTSLSPSNCILNGGGRAEVGYQNWGIKFSSDYFWYMEDDEPNGLGSAIYDLETTALHELGHTHGLLHSNNPNDIMWYDQNGGEFIRDVSSDALIGTQYAFEAAETRWNSNFCVTPITLFFCSGGNSIDEFMDENSDILIYPVPADNQLNFALDNKITGKLESVDIVNSIGQTISISTISNSGTLDISSLSDGVYYLMFKFKDNSIINEKFIKN